MRKDRAFDRGKEDSIPNALHDVRLGRMCTFYGLQSHNANMNHVAQFPPCFSRAARSESTLSESLGLKMPAVQIAIVVQNILSD